MIRSVLLALLLCACAKDADRAKGREPGAPPVLSTAEADRGVTACNTYVTRLCACATKDPTLQPSCDLARAQPEALDLHLHILHGKEGPLNDRERRSTESSARKIIAECIHSDSTLDPAKCPRDGI